MPSVRNWSHFKVFTLIKTVCHGYCVQNYRPAEKAVYRFVDIEMSRIKIVAYDIAPKINLIKGKAIFFLRKVFPNRDFDD